MVVYIQQQCAKLSAKNYSGRRTARKKKKRLLPLIISSPSAHARAQQYIQTENEQSKKSLIHPPNKNDKKIRVLILTPLRAS